MKNFLTYLIFLSFSLVVLSACQKDACIEGIVLDDKTGKPIAGATLTLRYNYTETGSLKYAQATVSTGQSGEFSFWADGRDISILEINKKGYSEAYTGTSEAGNCRNVTIKLRPLDGALGLSIVNETGIHDMIYVAVFSKCRYRMYFSSGLDYPNNYPLTLKQGGMYAKLFSCCVGDSTAVHWRFTKDGPWFKSDSFYITSSTPIYHEIKY